MTRARQPLSVAGCCWRDAHYQQLPCWNYVSTHYALVTEGNPCLYQMLRNKQSIYLQILFVLMGRVSRLFLVDPLCHAFSSLASLLTLASIRKDTAPYP